VLAGALATYWSVLSDETKDDELSALAPEYANDCTRINSRINTTALKTHNNDSQHEKINKISGTKGLSKSTMAFIEQTRRRLGDDSMENKVDIANANRRRQECQRDQERRHLNEVDREEVPVIAFGSHMTRFIMFPSSALRVISEIFIFNCE